MAALRQREQEEEIDALLARMQTITEANLEDTHTILQGIHDLFAGRIAEEVHVSILHCVETVSPIPSQTPVKRLEVCGSLHSIIAILTPLERSFYYLK